MAGESFRVSSWEPSTFGGLCAIMDNPKYPVSKACQAVEECIASNSDNLRGFFEQCFPTLLKHLFGYDGSSWLNLVAKSPKESDAKALLQLLSPTGVLFTAMYNTDSEGSTRFVFPKERLPTHTQMLLTAPAGLQELQRWPQYQRAIVNDSMGRPRIHLGVFAFFLYWWGFYVIRGGEGGMSDMIQSQGGRLSGSVRKAAGVLHLTRGRESDVHKHPYLAVLRQLLLELLPRPMNAAEAAAAATASKVGASPYFRTPKRAADSATRGLTLYSVLLEFWLTDGDEPVPLGSTGAFAERTPAAPKTSLTPLWSTTYEPPSEDLLEAVTELVRHATVADGGKPQPAQGAAPWLPLSPVQTLLPPTAAPRTAASLAGPPRLGAAAQPGAQAFALRLYRFFHRAFTMWPEQRSIKPLLRCFLAYIAPWHTNEAAPALAPGAFAAAPGNSHLGAGLTAHVSDLVQRAPWLDAHKQQQGRFGREWEPHVLSNLPFYCVLLPLFLEMSVARVEVRGESAAQDIVYVLGVLEAAPELRELLQRVERDYTKYLAAQPRRADGTYAELLPWLLEQSHDWEAAATVNCMGDTALARSSPAFTLFSAGDGSAAVTARDLLDLSSHIFKPDVQNRLQQCLEGVLPIAQLPVGGGTDAGRNAQQIHQDNAVPRLPKSSWQDVQYKGDPLMRPIASFEIGPLVRLLVALSKRLNAALGLDIPFQLEEEMDKAETKFDIFMMALRKHGWRFNLRHLADTRNLVWIPLAWLLCYWCFRAVAWLVWAIAAAPQALDAATGEQQRWQQAQQQRLQQQQQHQPQDDQW